MSNINLPQHSIVDDFIASVCHEHVEILYKDDDILLINKPSGLLSLSGKNPANWDSVHYRLVNGQPGLTAAFPTAKLPHRLDYGTSGIMIVGLNPESTKLLNKQFQSGTIKKHYIAMLDGWLLNDVGQINAAIVKDKLLFPLVKICNVTGKSAVSDYLVLQRLTSPPRTLVQFTVTALGTQLLAVICIKTNIANNWLSAYNYMPAICFLYTLEAPSKRTYIAHSHFDCKKKQLNFRVYLAMAYFFALLT